MRTSRLTVAAAALLAGLAVGSPAGAQPAGPPDTCPSTPGLGPPTACVAPASGGPSSTLARQAPTEKRDPGPALWVGAVFGVAGLGGIVFANGRIRDPHAEDQR